MKYYVLYIYAVGLPVVFNVEPVKCDPKEFCVVEAPATDKKINQQINIWDRIFVDGQTTIVWKI